MKLIGTRDDDKVLRDIFFFFFLNSTKFKIFPKNLLVNI